MVKRRGYINTSNEPTWDSCAVGKVNFEVLLPALRTKKVKTNGSNTIISEQ